MHHRSRSIDLWRPLYGEEGERLDESIDVRIEGFRHDHDDDWPDTIYAANVAPGFLAEVALQVPDARRLAKALLKACDLAEGKA